MVPPSGPGAHRWRTQRELCFHSAWALPSFSLPVMVQVVTGSRLFGPQNLIHGDLGRIGPVGQGRWGASREV